MQTQILGYPRIGNQRELKKAVEAFWNGTKNRLELEKTGRDIRQKNWFLRVEAIVNEMSLHSEFSLRKAFSPGSLGKAPMLRKLMPS